MSPTETGRTREATDLAARARRVLPGGATHAARTYAPSIYVDRAHGSRKWLVDGRELIDYTMGHGSLLLGHAHPAVVEAIRRQAGRGTHYGAANALEVEWAELITQMVPSAALVRFTASGTEAAMLAIRIARAATGRDRVVKLQEHFHGWSDVVSADLDATGRLTAPPGVPATVRDLTTVIPAGRAELLDETLSRRNVAAVILEPSGAHYGRLPIDAATIRAARAACDATDTVLIFDEVVTGFRVSPGGMQQVLGVLPDLSVLGKVMAGGLPAGAVAGKAALMELLVTTINHPGTYNANPLSASAGIATLRLAADGRPQRAAEGFARTLEREWRDALAAAGIPGEVRRLSSILHISLEDPDAQSRLSNALRAEGVDLLHTSAFCSAAHSLSDLEESADAFCRAILVSTQEL